MIEEKMGASLGEALRLNNSAFHICTDQETGLKAIVALNNTRLGPGLGGCRFISYASDGLALKDAMRLARGMALKSALAGLPFGGAKSVVMRPEALENREGYFRKFGQFIHELNGRYIAGIDSGTSSSDMDIMAQETPFVSCVSETSYSSSDPSPMTALGLIQSMKAACEFYLKKQSFEGLHVGVLGVGSVGRDLIRRLKNLGAQVTAYDINKEALKELRTHYDIIEAESLEDFMARTYDVFSPCALGGILTSESIPTIQAKIILGAANNQLEKDDWLHTLKEHGLVYVPDFLANAGGVIYVAGDYLKWNEEKAVEKVNKLYHTSLSIFERAERESMTPQEIAVQLAREKMGEL